MTQLNLNTMCEVTLTLYGARVHNQYLRPLKAANSKIQLVRAGQVMRTPLWQLMIYFGPHLKMGFGDMPFVSNEIRIEVVSNGTD